MALVAYDTADDGREFKKLENQAARGLLPTSMVVCIHTQVGHAWLFKVGLSRDDGLEHKSKEWFKLMLVAKH